MKLVVIVLAKLGILIFHLIVRFVITPGNIEYILLKFIHKVLQIVTI